MTAQQPDERMTRAERLELAKVIRMRARVAKSDVEALKARRVADFEESMATIYAAEDERWADITTAARRLVQEANDELRKRCADAGIPEEFAPRLEISWRSRGENAVLERRAELRKVAQTRADADAKSAHAAIARSESVLCTELAVTALTSAEASQWLEQLPSADALLPALTYDELEKTRKALRSAPRY